MKHGLTILKRTLMAPSLWPALFVACCAAWAGTWLAEQVLGGREGFVDEVRQGSLLFAMLLLLSLAEPVAVAAEVRGGWLSLRHLRGASPGLVSRWLALVVALLPPLLVVGLVAGGLPADPALSLVQLSILTAAALALGAWLDRRRAVPALWLLAVLGQLRDWLAAESWSAPLAACLPPLADVGWAGALWCLAALLLARGRVEALLVR